MSKPEPRKAETPQPMDPGAREDTTAQPITNEARDAYAVTVLAEEVVDVFPEVTYETVGANGRNVAIAVMFDDGETPDLFSVLSLVESDPRVESVDRDSAEPSVLVQFHNDPARYDVRDPFGLAEAYRILSESDEDEASSTAYEDDADEEADAEPEAEVEYQYRSAKTGRIVSEAYAKKNPDTTVRERVE